MNDGSGTNNAGSGRGALHGLLEAPATDRPAIIHDPAPVLTFGALRSEVDVLTERLRAAGVARGDRVGIVLPASSPAIAALFASWALGAVAVPVNPRLTPREQHQILDRAGATHRLDADGLEPTGATAPPSSPSDLALILTTSGTTGTPKPVELRHSKVLDGIDTVLASLRGAAVPPGPDPARPPVPNLVPVPLSLWAGTYQVLFAFRAGNPVVLLDPFTTAGFADAVRTHAIKSTVLAPAMMTALNDDDRITDLAPLRMVRSITAPLSVHQAQRFHERFGATVLNSYGQTELGGEVVGWTAADTRAHGTTKLGAVGRPHRGVRARIDDPDETGTGELCVQAPSMLTAADDPTLADRMTEDGHLRTGDIARIDDDGFIWLTGRVSDLINRGGMKVWPDDVEEVLRRHAGVRDAAVAGIPDDRLGQVPWAFLVAAGGTAPTDADLQEHCRRSLAGYKVPTRFVWIESLPRNEVGKVLRRSLIDTHGGAA